MKNKLTSFPGSLKKHLGDRGCSQLTYIFPFYCKKKKINKNYKLSTRAVDNQNVTPNRAPGFSTISAPAPTLDHQKSSQNSGSESRNMTYSKC